MSDGWDVGDRAEITVSFTRNGVPVSPTSVVGRVRDPAGVEAALTMTETGTGTGIYTGSVLLTAPRVWAVRVLASGSYEAAAVAEITVRRSLFDP